MIYKTKGTCSTQIDIEVDGDIIKSVRFTGGCNGNLQGVSRLVEGMKAEIPEVMYENRVNEMLNEFAMRLQNQGLSLDMYMKYSGQTPDMLKKTYREQAEKQVKLRLALEQVVKQESIEASAEEIESEINTIAQNNNITAEDVRKYVSDADVAKDIAVGKAVELIKSSAVIK